MALTRKAKPDADKLYEARASYADGTRVYRAGDRLRGDHPAVRAAFGRWMLDELPDDEKGKLRASAQWGQVNAAAAEHQPAPPPIAQRPSGKFRAVGFWTLTDPDLKPRGRIRSGEIVDADDELYRRYPHLFVPVIEERSR